MGIPFPIPALLLYEIPTRPDTDHIWSTSRSRPCCMDGKYHFFEARDSVLFVVAEY